MSQKSSIEAGKAHVTLGVDQGPLERGLNAAGQKFKDWGKSLSIIGGGISAVAAGILAPFYAGVDVLASWGREMNTGMREMGIGLDALDEIMDGMRVGLDELTPAIAKMSAFLQSAAQGSKDANQTLSDLGLTFEELNRMPQGDRVLAFADALSRVGDAGQRIAMQRDVFGRGGLALNIEGGAAGVRKRAARADEIEGVRTPGDLAAARAYNNALREMKLAMGGLWITIGSTVAPAMAAFVSKITEVVVKTRVWLDHHRSILAALFYTGTVLLSVGTTLTTLGGALWASGVAMSSLFGTVRLAVGGFVSFLGWMGPLMVGLSVLRYALLFSGFAGISYGLLAAQVGYEVLHYAIHFASHGFYIGAVASWVWGYAVAGATAVASAAIGAFNFAFGVIASGFGVITVATWAWGLGVAAASVIASAAVWAWGGVVAASQSIAGAAMAVWSAITFVAWVGATTQAIIYEGVLIAVSGVLTLLNAAQSAGAAIMAFFSASAVASGASVTGLGISELFASVSTTILTSGINLLVGALVLTVGAIAATIAALAALAAIGIVIGVALVYAGGIIVAAWSAVAGFFVSAVAAITSMTASLTEIINDPWEALVAAPVRNFVNEVVSILRGLWSEVMGVWNRISRALDDLMASFNNADMGTFANQLLYGVIGAIGMAVALGYVIYFLADMVEWATVFQTIWETVIEIFNMQFGITAITQIIEIAKAIYEFSVSAVAWVQQAFATMNAWIEQKFNELVDLIMAPIRSIGALISAAAAYILAPFARIFNAVHEAVRTTFAGLIEPLVQFGERVSQVFGQFAGQLTGWLGRMRYIIGALLSIGWVWDYVQAAIDAFATFGQSVRSVIDESIALVMSLLRPVIQLGRDLAGTLLGFLDALRSSFVSMASEIGGILGGLIPAAESVWAQIASGLTVTVGHFRETFSGIVASAMASFQAIKDAFGAGNWQLIWEIVKATALLMWHDLTALVQDTWTIWKSLGSEIFSQIGDALYNAMMDSWTAVQAFFSQSLTAVEILFDKAYEGIIDGFLNLADAVIAAWRTVHSFIMDSIRAILGAVGANIAARLGLGAVSDISNRASEWVAGQRLENRTEGTARREEVAGRGTADVARIRAERLAQAVADRDAAAARNAASIAEVERAILAAREGRQGDRDFLEAELDTLRIVAAADRARQQEILGESPSEGFRAADKGNIVGSFSNQALFGALGASGGMSPAARQLQATTAMLDEMRSLHGDTVAALRAIERVAGARLS